MARAVEHRQAVYQQGLALLQRQRLEEAAKCFEAVLALDHNHFGSLHNLGVIRIHQQRLEEANALLDRAIVQAPNNDQAHLNLGIALNVLNRAADAIVQFEKALLRNPNDARTRCYMAKTMLKLDRPEPALEHFEKVLALVPNDADAFMGQCMALEQLGRIDDACAAYRRLIALKPGNADALHRLGIALEIGGRLEEARQAFEQAIALEPRRSLYYHAISRTKRFAPDDPHLAAMETLARDIDSLSVNDRIDLHFGIAKALDDIGQRESAFRHLLAGNVFKRRSIRYDEAETLALFGRLPTIFSATLLRDKAGLGDPSPVPVFIIGMPRSGTSLIEQILASHPAIHAAGERDDLSRIVARDLPGGPETILAATDGTLRRMGADYLAAVSRQISPAPRITDKMPANFRFAGLIHLVLPNARIIHVRRDPIDTCLSIFSQLFEGVQPFAYDLGELGRYYRGYDGLMEHWRQVLPARVMLEVRYEELVANIEGEARRMIAHCGLDWDDACLTFYKTERPVRTASATQVRQPIYTSSIGRWRAYGALLDPLFEALGIDRLAASG